MSEGTIDKLVIEISSEASSATKGLSALVSVLGRLENATGSGFVKLTEVATAVDRLSRSANNLNLSKLAALKDIKIPATLGKNLQSLAQGVSAIPADANARLGALDSLKNLADVHVNSAWGKNLKELANAVQSVPDNAQQRIQPLASLKALNGLNISKSVATNLTYLASAISLLPLDSSTRLKGLSSALLPLKALNGMNIRAAVNQIRELPQVLELFKGLDVSGFVRQMQMLNPELRSLAANVYALGTAINRLPRSFRTAAAAARTLASSNRYLADSNVQVSRSTLNLAAALTAVIAGARTLINVIAKCIDESNSYIEDMNLFQATMGRSTQSASEFGLTCQDLLGIDFGEWARNQGVFQALATGMGVVSEKATVMSQQLTQLGYDIASFYNMSVDDAMLKIQSGIAGELEPLRRIGWDLSDARMNLELTRLGIDATTQEMTQAEKVALRYYLIMNQMTITHGDMARTIASPANQLRVLEAQVKLAARAIGDLFIPALNMILPVAIGAVKALRFLAQEIANFFGIDATFEVDYSTLDTSGIASVTDVADDAAASLDEASKAAKEYKNTVMGFDELNKLSAPKDDSSKSSGSGLGVGLDLPLDTYDFLAGLTDDIAQRTDEIAQQMIGAFKGALPYISAIGAAIAAWGITKVLSDILGLQTSWKTLLGIAMAAAGAVLLVWGYCDALANGLGWDNLIMMLEGAALLVGGLALAFGAPGAAIGLLISGLALLSIGLLDVYNNGLNLTNLTAIIAGVVAIVTGLGLAFGPVAAAIGAIVALVGVGAIALVDMFTNGQTWANALAAAVSEIGLGGLAAGLSNISEIIALVSRVAPPVGEVLSKIFGSFSGILGVLGKIAGVIGIIISVVDIVVSVGEIFDAVNSGGQIANETIFSLVTAIAGIGLALSAIVGWPALVVAAVIAAVVAIGAAIYNNWEEICAFFAGLPEWFDTQVVQPIGAFFGGIWTALCETFSGVADWVNQNVIQPLINFWSPIVAWFAELFSSVWNTISTVFYNIGVIGKGCWDIICKVWEIASTWFNDNVIKPVGKFFSDAWDTISKLASEAWTAISDCFFGAAAWIEEHVTKPIYDFFSGVWSSIVTCAQEAWGAITDIFDKVGGFMGGVIDGLSAAFKNIANGILGGINAALDFVFGGINGIIGEIRNFQVLDIQPFAELQDIPVPHIPLLASGGQVASGQLFVARENGIPEMVGQMGGQTTVANNEQIVEGIKRGVVEAMISVMSLNSASSNDSNQPVEFVLQVGQTELGRVAYKSMKDLARRGEIVFV